MPFAGDKARALGTDTHRVCRKARAEPKFQFTVYEPKFDTVAVGNGGGILRIVDGGQQGDITVDRRGIEPCAEGERVPFGDGDGL